MSRACLTHLVHLITQKGCNCCRGHRTKVLRLGEKGTWLIARFGGGLWLVQSSDHSSPTSTKYLLGPHTLVR